jgi:L-lysine 2,3-aminomutase
MYLSDLSLLREKYLSKFIDGKIKPTLKKLNLVYNDISDVGKKDINDWGDVRFHLSNRIHLNIKSKNESFDDLFNVYGLSDKHKNKLKQVIVNGISSNGEKRVYYDLSLLPLNMLLGKEVIKYFIPPIDYFDKNSASIKDPYGIVQGKTRSKGFFNCPAAIKSHNNNLLLGANKFTHSLLFNVDFYCPIGCSDCYKARMGTREYSSELKESSVIVDGLGEVIYPTIATVRLQAKQTVKWMNDSERGRNVYDVIISGGEPLMLSNEEIADILKEFKLAKNLKILRICTGTLFLGLPFRIDDHLLSLLRDFSDETGVRITIQAHVGNHYMISPESVIAIRKIKKYGFNVYAQVPIKNGINFFLDDQQKTINELSLLMHKLVIADVEPYMMIFDMHPSTNEYYVPIEPLLQVWGDLVESHDYPGLEKPRTISILFKQGNIILSGYSLFAISKSVDTANDLVHYQIPRIGVGEKWEGGIKEVFEYSEPLLKGINDNPDSLKKFRF